MGGAPHETVAPETILDEELDSPPRWRSKSVRTLLDFRNQVRGVRVNWRGEPSFRAWLLLASPFYVLAAFKRISLWRWLLLIVPHMSLLAGEMYNTAHEETIRQDERDKPVVEDETLRSKQEKTPHFRNAMDSASAAVGVKALIALICVLYALFGPDPWGPRRERARRMKGTLYRAGGPIGIVAVFTFAYVLFGRIDPGEASDGTHTHHGDKSLTLYCDGSCRR